MRHQTASTCCLTISDSGEWQTQQFLHGAHGAPAPSFIATSIAGPDPIREAIPMKVALCSKLNQRLCQYLGSSRQLSGLRILRRVVADPLAAWHEDHARRTNRHDKLRIVECT